MIDTISIEITGKIRDQYDKKALNLEYRAYMDHNTLRNTLNTPSDHKNNFQQLLDDAKKTNERYSKLVKNQNWVRMA